MKDSTEGSSSYANLLWEKLNWYVDQFAQDSSQTKGRGIWRVDKLGFFFWGGGNDVLSSKKISLPVLKRVSSYNTPVKCDG